MHLTPMTVTVTGHATSAEKEEMVHLTIIPTTATKNATYAVRQELRLMISVPVMPATSTHTGRIASAVKAEIRSHTYTIANVMTAATFAAT